MEFQSLRGRTTTLWKSSIWVQNHSLRRWGDAEKTNDAGNTTFQHDKPALTYHCFSKERQVMPLKIPMLALVYHLKFLQNYELKTHRPSEDISATAEK